MLEPSNPNGYRRVVRALRLRHEVSMKKAPGPMAARTLADAATLLAAAERGQAAARRVVKLATYHRVNGRRADLIDRTVDFPEAMSEAERLEYELLQYVVGVVLDVAFPSPEPSPELKALLEKSDEQ